ncbi:MAG: DJ-1 family glyoxalase III [Faecalimonas sp.]|nr:DJ-1 family glyoxalase III [Faecalimonas sp.]
MAKEVCVFLADGFEEIEGLTVVDLLRRAGVQVTTVSVTGNRMVQGAHGIAVQADTLFEEFTYEMQDMAVLPGGMPGTRHLGAHTGLRKVLEQFYDEKKYIAAICAAPSVLGEYGMLRGRKAVCYPGFEEALTGADVLYDAVAVDAFVITSRGMGTAIPFSLKLIEILCGEAKAAEIGAGIIYE